jgi:hypothetical protein
MTVAIATMGLYGNCRSVSGAPPYRQEEQEHVIPFVLVKNVEIKTIKLNEYVNIKVRFLDDGGNI